MKKGVDSYILLGLIILSDKKVNSKALASALKGKARPVQSTFRDAKDIM